MINLPVKMDEKIKMTPGISSEKIAKILDDVKG